MTVIHQLYITFHGKKQIIYDSQNVKNTAIWCALDIKYRLNPISYSSSNYVHLPKSLLSLK